jgi:hypothetical protein
MIIESILLGSGAIALGQVGTELAKSLIPELTGGAIENAVDALVARVSPERKQDLMQAIAAALKKATAEILEMEEMWRDADRAVWDALGSDAEKLFIEEFGEPQKAVQNALLLGTLEAVSEALESLIEPYFLVRRTSRSDEMRRLLPPAFLRAFEKVIDDPKYDRGWKAFQRALARSLHQHVAGLGKGQEELLTHLKSIDEGTTELPDLFREIDKQAHGRHLALLGAISEDGMKTRQTLEQIRALISELLNLSGASPKVSPTSFRINTTSKCSMMASVQPTPATTHSWMGILRAVLLSTIPTQLRSINIQSQSGLDSAYHELRDNPSFRQRLMSPHSLSHVPAIARTPSATLGVLTEDQIERLRDRSNMVDVAFPPTLLAISAIFFYLAYVRQVAINLQFSFAHAVELAMCIGQRNADPDVCVVGDAASLSLLNHKTRAIYDFLMLLPKSEQSIVAPKSSRNYKDCSFETGEFIFLSDEVSTPLFQFENFCARGLIDSKRAKATNCEPYEALSILRKGDEEIRSILWTPHLQISERIGVATVLNGAHASPFSFHTMLFAKRRFLRSEFRKAEALVVAIRDAWLDLYRFETLASTIEVMLSDDRYVKALGRYCGIEQMGIG